MNKLLSWMLPEQASTLAPTIDWMFFFITWVSIFFFVLVVALMLWFTFKYRRRKATDPAGKGINHHTGLELTWTILPCFIVVFMFWWGLLGFAESQTPPGNAITHNVVASQWKWDFYYPNGKSDSDLHALKGQPIELVMTSQDVLHALFVPVFRIKNDIVPGKYSRVWFEATKSGDFQLFCAEFCGDSHSLMLARVVIHETQETLDKYYSELGGRETGPDGEYVEGYEHFGYRLFDEKGCAQCHSRGVEPGTQGPGWKQLGELFGKERELAGGKTVAVDENYIKESILEPRKKIVSGFSNIMTPQNLTDEQIMGVIAYIKWLGKNDAGEVPPKQ